MTVTPLYETKEAKNVARLAMCECDAQLAAQHAAGIFDEGDPNHPKYNNGINYATGMPVSLFGHKTKDFLAKQYH